jgi:hypothetical protein
VTNHVSPGTVLAAVALFAALAGPGIAGVDRVTALITGAQIKNSSITGADVKNRSLTAADFRGSVQGPRGLRGATGPTGAAGAAGAQGPPGIQRLVPVTASKPVPIDVLESVIAGCPPGMVAVSGGFNTDSDGAIYASHSVGTGWFVEIDTRNGAVPGNVTAYAYCSPNITTSAAVVTAG